MPPKIHEPRVPNTIVVWAIYNTRVLGCSVPQRIALSFLLYNCHQGSRATTTSVWASVHLPRPLRLSSTRMRPCLCVVSTVTHAVWSLLHYFSDLIGWRLCCSASPFVLSKGLLERFWSPSGLLESFSVFWSPGRQFPDTDTCIYNVLELFKKHVFWQSCISFFFIFCMYVVTLFPSQCMRTSGTRRLGTIYISELDREQSLLVDPPRFKLTRQASHCFFEDPHEMWSRRWGLLFGWGIPIVTPKAVVLPRASSMRWIRRSSGGEGLEGVCLFSNEFAIRNELLCYKSLMMNAMN